MKKVIMLAAIVVILTSCATPQKMNAIREAIEAGRVLSMSKETRLEYTLGFPSGMSGSHPGPYRSLDSVNAKVITGEYAGKNATFLLGESRETLEWELLSVLIQEEGKWRPIPLR